MNLIDQIHAVLQSRPWMAAAQLGVVVSVMSVWFLSDFAVRIALIIRAMGWKKKEEGFWPSNLESKDKEELDGWAAWVFRDRWWKAWLVHLFVCPVCLGVHISAWTSVLAFAASGDALWVITAPLLYATSLLGFGAIKKAIG